jgi:hypothetical protein
LISILVGAKGDLTFSVSQPDQADFLDVPKFKYSSCRFIVIKLRDNETIEGGVDFIAGKLNHWEKDYHLECENIQ